MSLRKGFGVAWSRVQAILFWSLLAGVVGLIIRNIEERLGIIGRIIAGLIGLAWSVAATFAIPVLLEVGATSNPVKILTQSATTIKRTWGEMLVGYVGMRGTNWMVLLGSVLFWVVAIALGAVTHQYWLLIPIGCLWLVCVLVYAFLSSIASRIYLCALYVYSTQGVVPGNFDQSMMDMAWKVRKD